MSRPESDDWYWEARWGQFRTGTTPLSVTWDGGSARGILYDTGAPRTVRAVIEALPLTVPVVHAAWSGEMLMSTRAYELDATSLENQVRLVRPGELTWDPKFGELAFVYGTAECRLPTGPNTLVVYGTLCEGLEDFAAFGRRRRFDGVGRLSLQLA